MTSATHERPVVRAPETSRYRIQAIERAVSILNAFSTEHPEYGVTELAAELGLHKSTVHRFLVNLETAGLVERSPRTGRYRLGLRILELGGLVMQQLSLWDEALPFLEGLVRDAGETGHLAVLDGGEAIYIEKVETHRALRIPSAVGQGYPAHATSLGKVLLAHLPLEEVRGIATERGLAACTASTITSLERLEPELAMVREQGYAVDNEEYDDGLRCIGAPIKDHTGQVMAAIGVGGPVTRVTPGRVAELADLVTAAARGLSRRLGAGPAGRYATPAVRVRTADQERLLPPPPTAV